MHPATSHRRRSPRGVTPIRSSVSARGSRRTVRQTRPSSRGWTGRRVRLRPGPERVSWRWSHGPPRSCSPGCMRTCLRTSFGSEMRCCAMPEVTMGRALNEALRQSLATDDRTLVFGEDVGRLGGVFRVTEGLQEEFGEQRVFDTPLAESGIAGISVGLAMAGWKPVVEMQFDAFSYPALNQVISHVAKYRHRTRGRIGMPIVIRIPFGGGIGAAENHSDSPETYYAHTAGLKVVAPSSALDAYALLRKAIEDPDPVVFLEPKARYWSKEDGEQDEAAAAPIGMARIVRPGSDCTVIAYGAMVARALAAAEQAATR